MAIATEELEGRGAISSAGGATKFLQEYRERWDPFNFQGEEREGMFLVRVDPLSGNQSRICEDRAKRNIGIRVDLDIRPVENCAFCKPFTDAVPRNRIEHECGALTIRNLNPWERSCVVTLYPPLGQHRPLLSDLYFNHLECMIESEYDLALEFARQPGVVGFTDFTNWGPYAGASQQHPHSQRTTITGVLDPVQTRELERCRLLYDQYGVNPFDMLIREERADGRRLVHDNDIFIAAQFAPTFPHEIIVIPKHDIAHILQTNSADRRQIIKPALGVFHALFFYGGITNLNVAVHMAPFAEMDEARAYFRWHIHIYPRRASLPSDRAGAELGYDLNVIDVLPENTAAKLRAWFDDGPREELLARRPDGTTDPKLVELFHRCVGQTCPS
ncbi:MAG: hypothetical protein M1370_02270 [Bacteroidetes bacterium]|nr:hypothetical protein [Bacteroidota bacterium]MCL5025555.1 hypothetical protein [Chloroflexota bacterium]